ncbi:ParB/RepB/Spo0J family partition protein [Brochothrix campestris]|uniref:Stage 0 sporulation protein J n=1 Tax=Brochothrix campestris FSL F6-1037 TaxID=1265861 RepID=W7D1M1_9LIST|nr:ParB/RepB/Spo0J family partition protein [Brochothrix campestris]EUJ41816.1 stage 0 sporulation protein J [Brochothrix campestris FSL F6-1037]
MAKGLGKGIDALFGDMGLATDETIEDVQLVQITSNPYQPRTYFAEEALNELAASIRLNGVLQPVILRKMKNKYEIVAGERRCRASKIAGKDSVPAIIRTYDDKQMMELAILENLQRENLSALEEATAYQLLVDKQQLTQAEIAKKLGKSRPYIANYLRLLKLPSVVKAMMETEQLSTGQARALLGLTDVKRIVPVAKYTVKQQLTVRQLERYVTECNEPTPQKSKAEAVKKPQFIRATEAELQRKFGSAVAIKKQGKKGKIEIEFLSEADFNRILDVLEIEL